MLSGGGSDAVLLQIKKLKNQLEVKSQKNGSESSSSPDGDPAENGSDPNIMELQSRWSRSVWVPPPSHTNSSLSFQETPTAR